MPRYRLPDRIAEFAGNTCFICQVELTKDPGKAKRTLEHLLPQWMIDLFDLNEKTLTMGLLGEFAYMNWLLPCCSECNSHLLAPVERNLKKAVTGDDPEKISEQRMAIWVSKVLLGTLLYEKAAMGDAYQDFWGEAACREYLTGLRGTKVLEHRNTFGYPFTLFWLRSKTREGADRNFDLQICSASYAVYVRLGSLAILARPDNGLLHRVGSQFFEPHVDRLLAPLQIEELAAHFFTMAGRAHGTDLKITRPPVAEGGPEHVVRAAVSAPQTLGRAGGDDFRYWYSRLTGGPESELFAADGSALTFLTDSKRCPVDRGADDGWH